MSECELCHEDHCMLRVEYPDCPPCQFEGDASEIGVGCCLAKDSDLIEVEEENYDE